MKYIFILLMIVSCASATKAGDGKSFAIGKPEQTTLKNGMRILWLPDNALPYVSFQMLIRAGAAQDPAGKEGLANFTSALLEKGTAKRSATQIADDLGELGASFSAEAASDYTILSGSGLSFHNDKLLSNFSEIVLNPSFPNAEIERQRKILAA